MNLYNKLIKISTELADLSSKSILNRLNTNLPFEIRDAHRSRLCTLNQYHTYISESIELPEPEPMDCLVDLTEDSISIRFNPKEFFDFNDLDLKQLVVYNDALFYITFTGEHEHRNIMPEMFKIIASKLEIYPAQEAGSFRCKAYFLGRLIILEV